MEKKQRAWAVVYEDDDVDVELLYSDKEEAEQVRDSDYYVTARVVEVTVEVVS